jgi:hypothetical protein
MIKIPPSMMSQNWMGSDFTNDDLVKMNSLVDDYESRVLDSEQVNGLDCYKIELIPNENASVVWGKVHLWIAKDDYYQMKAAYFDEDFNLVSKMEASEITDFGDRSLPARLVMTPIDKPGNQTILLNKSLTFNEPIDEGFFSQQNMKKVR